MSIRPTPQGISHDKHADRRAHGSTRREARERGEPERRGAMARPPVPMFSAKPAVPKFDAQARQRADDDEVRAPLRSRARACASVWLRACAPPAGALVRTCRPAGPRQSRHWPLTGCCSAWPLSVARRAGSPREPQNRGAVCVLVPRRCDCGVAGEPAAPAAVDGEQGGRPVDRPL